MRANVTGFIRSSFMSQTKQSRTRCVSVSNSTRIGTSAVGFRAWFSKASCDLALHETCTPVLKASELTDIHDLLNLLSSSKLRILMAVCDPSNFGQVRFCQFEEPGSLDDCFESCIDKIHLDAIRESRVPQSESHHSPRSLNRLNRVPFRPRPAPPTHRQIQARHS